MKNILFITLTVMSVFLFFVVGCDIGINPLVLDGSIASDYFRVNINSPLPFPLGYNDSLSFELSKIKEVTDKAAESIKFYNMTILIDSNTSNVNARISGSLIVDGFTIVRLDSVSPSIFSSERSIFDATITGFHYNSAGVSHLISLLKLSPIPTVTLKASLGPVTDAVHFRMRVKVYGQIIAKAKN